MLLLKSGLVFLNYLLDGNTAEQNHTCFIDRIQKFSGGSLGIDMDAIHHQISEIGRVLGQYCFQIVLPLGPAAANG